MNSPKLYVRTVVLTVVLLAGCANLYTPQGRSPNIYLLDLPPSVQTANVKHDLVLAVNMLPAPLGFETPQIAYSQRAHELDYFANSRWADTPTRMIQPLLFRALQQTTSFRAVVQATSLIPADVRLDVELIRLQQNFASQPSRVEITLRAQLIDMRSNRVLASQQFDATENARSEDAYGGVDAANRLSQRVLGQLTEFCITAPIPQ